MRTFAHFSCLSLHSQNPISCIGVLLLSNALHKCITKENSSNIFMSSEIPGHMEHEKGTMWTNKQKKNDKIQRRMEKPQQANTLKTTNTHIT